MTVGVVVSTNTRAGASEAPRAPESHTFVIVQAERGRTDTAVLIRNPQAYANEFGEWVNYGFGTDFINTHFALGGAELYVARRVGPSATLGTLTLVNRVGSPLNAMRLDAISAGAWSADVRAKVEDGTVTNSVTVTISYKNGLTAIPDEVYRNVGLDNTGAVSIQTIVDAINARSNQVVATNLGAATTGATARLALIAATALSAGTDDRAAATSAVMTAGLDIAFPSDLGPGAVAVPGYLHTDIATAMGAHCLATKRVGIVAGTYLESTASIQSAAATIQGASSNGGHLLLAYPWIQVPAGNASSKWIEPTGYFTGVRSRTSERIGTWQEPGGTFGADERGYVLGLATKVDAVTNNALETAGVSALMRIAGVVEPMGWRNLGTDQAFSALSDTDEKYAVAWECAERLRPINWWGIDDKHRTLYRAVGACQGVVASRALGGAYHSLNGDAGYSADGTEDIPNSAIRVRVGFRRRAAAKLIYLDVTASASNAPV